MIEQSQLQLFTEKLVSLGIPHHTLKVFGNPRLSVNVVCKSRTAADRWAMVLSAIEPGRKIACVKTRIERVAFKLDAANQQSVRGWLVSL